MNLRTHIKRFLAGVLVASAGVAFAATFQYFSPATGILKGNASTYVTTAAVSADIRGLWTGTCDITTFLRGDGACAQVNLTTNVSGVLPVPNGGSGAATLTGVLHGNGTGPFTAANVNLATEVTGTLPIANGGTGQVNATSAFNALSPMTTFGDMIYGGVAPAGTGTRVAGNTTTDQRFLSQTGNGTIAGVPTWSALPGSFSGFADPTASLGLTAVNGSATTAMRSDAAPALSQSIVPSWTGLHTFAATSVSLAVAPASGEGVIRLSSPAAGADLKHWLIREVDSASGAFRLSTASDAAPSTPVSTALNIVRSGTSISSVGTGAVVLGVDGAVGAPGFSFTGDPNTGMYRIGTDDLGLAAGGLLIAEFVVAGGQRTVASQGALAIPDGITAPTTVAGLAFIYVDVADGDLKVKFGDGTVRTLATD